MRVPVHIVNRKWRRRTRRSEQKSCGRRGTRGRSIFYIYWNWGRRGVAMDILYSIYIEIKEVKLKIKTRIGKV